MNYILYIILIVSVKDTKRVNINSICPSSYVLLNIINHYQKVIMICFVIFQQNKCGSMFQTIMNWMMKFSDPTQLLMFNQCFTFIAFTENYLFIPPRKVNYIKMVEPAPLSSISIYTQ